LKVVVYWAIVHINKPRRVVMSKDDFKRFEFLSEKSIFGDPTQGELIELQQLMVLWNASVQNKEQLSKRF
jgi:hypothetical protein